MVVLIPRIWGHGVFLNKIHETDPKPRWPAPVGTSGPRSRWEVPGEERKASRRDGSLPARAFAG